MAGQLRLLDAAVSAGDFVSQGELDPVAVEELVARHQLEWARERQGSSASGSSVQ